MVRQFTGTVPVVLKPETNRCIKPRECYLNVKTRDDGSSLEDNIKAIILNGYVSDRFHPCDTFVNEEPTYLSYDAALKILCEIKHI